MGTQVKTFPRTVAGTRVECGFGPTHVQSYQKPASSSRMGTDGGSLCARHCAELGDLQGSA